MKKEYNPKGQTVKEIKRSLKTRGLEFDCFDTCYDADGFAGNKYNFVKITNGPAMAVESESKNGEYISRKITLLGSSDEISPVEKILKEEEII